MRKICLHQSRLEGLKAYINPCYGFITLLSTEFKQCGVSFIPLKRAVPCADRNKVINDNPDMIKLINQQDNFYSLVLLLPKAIRNVFQMVGKCKKTLMNADKCTYLMLLYLL